MIRKLVFAALLLLLACLLCACGEPAVPAPTAAPTVDVSSLDPNTLEGKLAGVWLVETASAEGMRMDMSQYNLRVTLTLNPDGSAAMDYNGEIDGSMSWRVENGKAYLTGYSESGEVEINVREDGLIITDEIGSMYLARE